MIAISAAYAVGSEFRRRSMTRVVGSVRPQHRRRPGGQAAAVFHRAVGDVRADGRDPRPVARCRFPRERSADDGRRHAADRCLPDDRLPAAVADAEPGGRPQPDGDHRLPGLRLCGRRIPGHCHGLVSSRMGRDPAAALVHPDPVRPGRARGAGTTRRRIRSRASAAITAILMALVWLRCRALARTGFAAPD